jgi:hypothetical protein
VELVPGRRVVFLPDLGHGPGVVASRQFGRTIAPGAGSIRTNGPAYCLGCLARHPEATFADRLKAHRLAAGLTLMGLDERIGVPHQRGGCDYECGLCGKLGASSPSLWYAQPLELKLRLPGEVE